MDSDAFSVEKGSDATVGGIVRASLASISENLQALVDKELTLTTQAPTLVDSTTLPALLEGRHTMLSGNLEKDYEGTIRILFNLDVSITLSCYLRMIPDDVVDANRKTMSWTTEDDESFSEVGNILFSALDEALRSSVDNQVNIRLDSFARVDGSSDGVEALGDGSHLAYPFDCKIADISESKGFLLIPLPAAEALNREPLRFGGAGESNEEEDDFEAAPIRGDLAAYVSDARLLKVIKSSCRRVGLNLDRRPKAEVPNPAAYAGSFVIIEIGPGQERRFDWCRRIKAAEMDVTVALVLVSPTKLGVASAFKAQADAILGWPLREPQVSEKLTALLEVSPKP